MFAAEYADPREISAAVAELIRPVKRLRPSEAAIEVLRSEKGPWDPTLTPELIEPLDLLASREYTEIVYVGPARAGKTMSLLLGGVAYITTVAPGDTLIVQMSQDTARDFSRLDLDRAIRNSPKLAERLSPRPRDDNTYDKFFRSGMVVKLGWPSVSQVSGKTFKYGFATDYDRSGVQDDVDGEGPLFRLIGKRMQTHGSRGKNCAESSPEIEWTGTDWTPAHPHEGPPVKGGIVSLYNGGTQARYYWPCQHCGEYFQASPGLEPFALPEEEELERRVLTADLASLAAELARVCCTRCGALHEMSQRAAMKARARWVHRGESIDRDGRITGERVRTRRASFWAGGVVAAFQSWESLLGSYLGALAACVRTGDESTLRFCVNTELAAPYVPRAAKKRRKAEALMKRREHWERGEVPAGVRFLTAQIDVQGNRFVVEVRGWGVQLETWLVERFAITSSRRPEGERFAVLEPAAYAEDWGLIRDEIMGRTYALAGHPQVRLGIVLTVCDSGGKAGVTSKAYDFYRTLRAAGLHYGFALVKGDSSDRAPLIRETKPDERSDRTAGGRGDVPVWLLNTTLLKDAVVGEIAREAPGPGYWHFPDWIERPYFEEITAEVRTEKGWQRLGGARNEAFDLAVYGRAACLILGAHRIDWGAPPEWAMDPLQAPRVPKSAGLAKLADMMNG